METLTTVLLIVVVLICIKVYMKLTTGKYESQAKMYGKTVIITGANTGIGKETALDLASRGAHIILACRNLQLAERAKNDIILKTGNNNIVARHVDLMCFESIKKFVQTIYETEERLDVLINNAGVAYLGKTLTKEGLNPTMQVNHFGPFLLTNLLLDLLKKSAPSRIITVSSFLHMFSCLDLNNLYEQKNVSEFFIYCNSKLCNILMSHELAERLEGTNVTSNSIHPGVIFTKMYRNVPFPLNHGAYFLTRTFCKNRKEGIQTTIYATIADELANVSGAYFSDCKQLTTAKIENNRKIQKKLWELSEKAVKLADYEKFYKELRYKK